MKQKRHPLQAFTLIEIMIVVAIIGIVIAIALPSWIRQRRLSQGRTCSENLSKIDGAKQQWALEENQAPTATPGWSDLVSAAGDGYIKKQPECPADGEYSLNSVADNPVCDSSAKDTTDNLHVLP